MLTPTLEELLKLRYQAHNLGLVSSRRTQIPLSGLYASVFRGHGIDFNEVREYQAGDEIRNIDWRVTARMGKPYLKVYRTERERHVVLCVDRGPHTQFGTRGTFKSIQVARVAALLGWSAQGHGDRISGILFGQGQPQFFRPQRAKRSFLQLLRSLTLSPPSHPISVLPKSTTPLIEALTMLNRNTHHSALIFVIADLHQTPLASLRQSLTQLYQRYELVLITIDDPADYALPAIGTIQFRAPDGTQVTVNTDHFSGRYRYRQAWETQRQALQQLVRKLSIDLITISTQTDVYQSLFKGLQQRAQQLRSHR